MRKITTEAAEAFFNRKDFKKSNTEVHNSPNGDTTMLLHDNEIAILSPEGELRVTNAGWKTNTTKERLNGLLGVIINQKNFVWHLNGEAWGGEWKTV